MYSVSNLWKKDTSFLWTFVLFLVPEITYITSIESTADAAWYQRINVFFVILWAIPALVCLGIILWKRAYMPKAPKNTKGIIFYIVNADAKQYKAINQKFIKPLKEMVAAEMPEYSVVVIDDYHSQKYYPMLCEKVVDDGEKQVKVLERRRGCIAVSIDCENGGDGEALFCHMKTTLGVTFSSIPSAIMPYLLKDISAAFLPLRNVNIMKLTETPDLSRYSFSLDVALKYVLASIRFHCGDFAEAIKLLETIESKLAKTDDYPQTVSPIATVLSNRLAICYRVYAQSEYQSYCVDRDEKHLVEIRRAINNKHCKKEYQYDTKVLEGICCFILDKDIRHAIQCMNAYNGKESVVKFNKAFLYLYERCTVTNMYKVYNLYKSFETLPDDIQAQIETFTYCEFKKDKTKKQLLWILFFIYDCWGNSILAKRCFEQFCTAFPWVAQGQTAMVINELGKKYADVCYDEGETYDI